MAETEEGRLIEAALQTELMLDKHLTMTMDDISGREWRVLTELWSARKTYEREKERTQ